MQSRRLIVPADHRMLAWLLAVATLSLAAGMSLAAPNRAGAVARLAQCANNVDDDGDGKVDFPAEPGCTAPSDTSEVDPSPLPLCADGFDNDGDNTIDFPQEPGCASAANKSEKDPMQRPQCADGIDNDTDGKIDYPKDPGCNWAADREADTACSDGIDDDGDGKVDFPRDIGCADANDKDEANPPECNDGRDNDGDGTLDFDTDIPVQTADPDCASAVDTVEAPSSPPLPLPLPAGCADGRDNDADGRIDFPIDPGCSSPADDDETNPATILLPPSSVQTRLLTPFPIVRIRGRSDRNGVRITLLTVRAPKASKVSIYCTGRSCPRRRLAITASGGTVRVRRFERRLRGGSILKIYVTKPGFIGKYTRFRFRNGGVPLRVDLCARNPGSQPLRCPAY
jgi:hypothetical protein